MWKVPTHLLTLSKDTDRDTDIEPHRKLRQPTQLSTAVNLSGRNLQNGAAVMFTIALLTVESFALGAFARQGAGILKRYALVRCSGGEAYRTIEKDEYLCCDREY